MQKFKIDVGTTIYSVMGYHCDDDTYKVEIVDLKNDINTLIHKFYIRELKDLSTIFGIISKNLFKGDNQNGNSI